MIFFLMLYYTLSNHLPSVNQLKTVQEIIRRRIVPNAIFVCKNVN